MTTENLIAGKKSAKGNDRLSAVNPKSKSKLDGSFAVATAAEVDQAVLAAYESWKIYKKVDPSLKAKFLRTIADEIEALGDTLVARVMAESGLPEGRVKGERGRTCGQLRHFADHVEEGSWVDAIIDEALPDRKPMPRSDIRKISVALGPVAVFTASNFPLAFSTAGGDTASALAAGCPVIVKAHPSHLGTNAMVASAITMAVQKCGLPAGVFSSVQGNINVGQELVKHPKIKAVAFTGSLKGGKAIFDLANTRPEPIPVYAEMGSTNPVYLLPEKVAKDSEKLASMIANSVNMGAGQFCTNPGMLVVQKGQQLDSFKQQLQEAFSNLDSYTMLNEGIYKAFEKGKEASTNTAGVAKEYESTANSDQWVARPAFATVSAADFMKSEALHEEVFGPYTLMIECDNEAQSLELADTFHGQLTATIIGTEEEIAKKSELAEILSQKAGRVIFNGVPTGVEVCQAMHHGGPYPSATGAMYTSVGMDAIKRFARPVAYQDAPQSLLPPELKDGNPASIWRTVNNVKQR